MSFDKPQVRRRKSEPAIQCSVGAFCENPSSASNLSSLDVNYGYSDGISPIPCESNIRPNCQCSRYAIRTLPEQKAAFDSKSSICGEESRSEAGASSGKCFTESDWKQLEETESCSEIDKLGRVSLAKGEIQQHLGQGIYIDPFYVEEQASRANGLVSDPKRWDGTLSHIQDSVSYENFRAATLEWAQNVAPENEFEREGSFLTDVTTTGMRRQSIFGLQTDQETDSYVKIFSDTDLENSGLSSKTLLKILSDRKEIKFESSVVNVNAGSGSESDFIIVDIPKPLSIEDALLLIETMKLSSCKFTENEGMEFNYSSPTGSIVHVVVHFLTTTDAESKDGNIVMAESVPEEFPSSSSCNDQSTTSRKPRGVRDRASRYIRKSAKKILDNIKLVNSEPIDE